MILGEECDFDTAYFMKYGRYPTPDYSFNYKQVSSSDYDYDEQLYKDYQDANAYEYFDWASTYRYCLWK